MSNEVNIKLNTRIVHNGEKDQITTQLTGNLYEKDDEFFLRYKEGLEQELGNTWTTVRWKKEASTNVTILRQGDIKMKQTFNENIEDIGQYHSPYGILVMKTTTHELSIIDCTASSGRLEVHYELVINQQNVGQYWLEVEYSNSNTGG